MILHAALPKQWQKVNQILKSQQTPHISPSWASYRMSIVSILLNSLRPSDAIWRQWSWTTLAQVMACCLTAPSHYLNQCWLIIRGVLWHTSESSFAGIAQGIDSGYEFEKDILKNIFKSPRGQWVKIDSVITASQCIWCDLKDFDKCIGYNNNVSCTPSPVSVPNVDLPPLCSPKFKPGPPLEQAQAACVFMDELIKW